MRKSELMTLWNVESWAVEPYGAIFVSDVDQSPRKIEYHWPVQDFYKRTNLVWMIF